jgi:hypothetical protein
LNSGEHDRNNGNHRAKHVEQDLRCPDSHKLAAEFSGRTSRWLS